MSPKIRIWSSTNGEELVWHAVCACSPERGLGTILCCDDSFGFEKHCDAAVAALAHYQAKHNPRTRCEPHGLQP